MKLIGRLLVVILLCSYSAACPIATANTYELTVSAGKHDRTNTPVSVLIEESNTQANLDPVVLGEARSVTLLDPHGNRLPAQLTAPDLLHQPESPNAAVVRQIHFILPTLKKGKTLKLTATVSESPQADNGFSWQTSPGEFSELSFGDRPVLKYMCTALDDSTPEAREQTYKVFHHLYDPTGTRLVTKGPGGKYTHHRGIFFGFNRITYGDEVKVDIWHCKGDTHQSHEGVLAEEAGAVLGRHTLSVDWHGTGSGCLPSNSER